MSSDMRPEWQQTIDPAGTAFFLDVDGTLLGFKDRPEDVVADEELRGLLRRLEAKAGGAVALISGRMIDDLDRIVAPLVLAAGGVHGAEIRFADGRRTTAAGDALASLREKAQAFVDQTEGLRLEDKGATIAIHYRQAPDSGADVVRFAEDAIGGDDLMVQRGKMVAEVKSSQSHKGRAIETLMGSEPFSGRTPLFIGDDLTDERGFEYVNSIGGVSIKVGEAADETIAVRRLEDPGAVHNFLAALCR